ncbi:MAG: hypothetical protein J6O61_10540 [Butyrivibrio sp.]|uniref:hypothetical protein n=1 Tax=Butyrivibrio sp. TaxID=28121 RepID=UPI001AFF60A1|nr:hypothetical protein [Butyrivibrio sp.]MBO6241247.1 hypothetical protein [Butyrivibrio sp.]
MGKDVQEVKQKQEIEIHENEGNESVIEEQEDGKKIDNKSEYSEDKKNIDDYYKRILDNSRQKELSKAIKYADYAEENDWTIISGITMSPYKQKLASNRDAYKARRAESDAIDQARQIFNDADLCTIRERRAMYQYFNGNPDDKTPFSGGDSEDNAELLKYVQSIVYMDLSPDMFTDDYLSDHIVELYDYATKLELLDQFKKDYPVFYKSLSDEKRASLDARGKYSSEIKTVLIKHMNLHGIDTDGFKDKMVILRFDSDDKKTRATEREVLKNEYETELNELLDKLVEDQIDLAEAYDDRYSAKNAEEDLEESYKNYQDVKNIFGDEIGIAIQEMKKAWAVRDELLKKQKESLERFKNAKDDTEKSRARAQVTRFNIRIRLASEHADGYRDFLKFVTGQTKEVSDETAAFLQDENRQELMDVILFKKMGDCLEYSLEGIKKTDAESSGMSGKDFISKYTEYKVYKEEGRKFKALKETKKETVDDINPVIKQIINMEPDDLGRMRLAENQNFESDKYWENRAFIMVVKDIKNLMKKISEQGIELTDDKKAHITDMSKLANEIYGEYFAFEAKLMNPHSVLTMRAEIKADTLKKAQADVFNALDNKKELKDKELGEKLKKYTERKSGNLTSVKDNTSVYDTVSGLVKERLDMETVIQSGLEEVNREKFYEARKKEAIKKIKDKEKVKELASRFVDDIFDGVVKGKTDKEKDKEKKDKENKADFFAVPDKQRIKSDSVKKRMGQDVHDISEWIGFVANQLKSLNSDNRVTWDEIVKELKFHIIEREVTVSSYEDGKPVIVKITVTKDNLDLFLINAKDNFIQNNDYITDISQYTDEEKKTFRQEYEEKSFDKNSLADRFEKELFDEQGKLQEKEPNTIPKKDLLHVRWVLNNIPEKLDTPEDVKDFRALWEKKLGFDMLEGRRVAKVTYLKIKGLIDTLESNVSKAVREAEHDKIMAQLQKVDLKKKQDYMITDIEKTMPNVRQWYPNSCWATSGALISDWYNRNVLGNHDADSIDQLTFLNPENVVLNPYSERDIQLDKNEQAGADSMKTEERIIRSYVRPEGKFGNLMSLSDVMLSNLSNTAVRQLRFDIPVGDSNYDFAKMTKDEKLKIVKLFFERVENILKTSKTPISLLIPGHYRTIMGFKNGVMQCRDSSLDDGNKVKELTVEEFLNIWEGSSEREDGKSYSLELVYLQNLNDENMEELKKEYNFRYEGQKLQYNEEDEENQAASTRNVVHNLGMLYEKTANNDPDNILDKFTYEAIYVPKNLDHEENKKEVQEKIANKRKELKLGKPSQEETDIKISLKQLYDDEVLKRRKPVKK